MSSEHVLDLEFQIAFIVVLLCLLVMFICT